MDRRREACRTNAAQVTQVRRIIEGLGLEVASPDEARAMLALKGGDKVDSSRGDGHPLIPLGGAGHCQTKCTAVFLIGSAATKTPISPFMFSNTIRQPHGGTDRLDSLYSCAQPRPRERVTQPRGRYW